MSFKQECKTKTNNRHYDSIMTPAYPYTPSPTPNSSLPYNTADAFCKTTFQELEKDNFKAQKRLDISGAFPYFEPSEGKKCPIQIISECSDKEPLPPSKNHKSQQLIIVSDNNKNELNEEEEKKINIKDLKISIPTKNNKRRSRKFSLIDINTKEIAIQSLENKTLSLHGYKKHKFIAATLQGHIITAIMETDKDKDNKTVIIKTSNKELHSQHITIQKHGKTYKIEEDIVKEAELMKKFMASPHPSALIEYYDFFEDKENYYIVMENGGNDLFDFIVRSHQLINSNKLSIREWRRHCKFMFAQMVLFMGWMHKIQHCCNLDISLENMLICHGININISNEDEFKLNQCYIKFIDFGLSEFFDPMMNPCFLCNKFVGKQRYKAPEVYGHKGTFRADKADIWSLGVVLFMMAVGAPPYNKAIDGDIAFKYIKSGRIADLLQSWNRLGYVTANLLDLLKLMLCVNPSKRINIEQIMKHQWISVYFPKKQSNSSSNATPSNINV